MGLLRGKASQLLLSLALGVICVACYVLLVLLFAKADIYGIQSFTNPDLTSFKPTVAVSLLAAALSAATVTLVTRCVEQSLWLSLRKESDAGCPRDALTVGESRRLAQWSTSTLERLLYLFGGWSGDRNDRRSWLLRVAGPLLVASAVVGPVLLVGISVSDLRSTTVEDVPRQADQWLSHLDVGNSRYRGGQSYDNPTFVAALAAMRNLSAPIAPLCKANDARSACFVSARAVSIRASCTGRSSNNPDKIGALSGLSNRNESSRFCAGEDTATELCVELVSSSPATYAAFASGLPACSSKNISDCSVQGMDGKWARIYGAFVNGVDVSTDSDHRLHEVECDLTYGNITINQNGTSPPTLDRSSFEPCDAKEAYNYGGSNYSITQLNRIYTELGNSPYDWELKTTGTGSNTVYQTPLAFLLLGLDANYDADTVARQIEANFEMATLHAFAKASNSSDLVFTRSKLHSVYVYDRIVLAILLVPLLATFLGTWMRWRTAGEDVMIGYDPIQIARLGPVAGMTQWGSTMDQSSRKQEDASRVWSWSNPIISQGQPVRVWAGFQVDRSGGAVVHQQNLAFSK